MGDAPTEKKLNWWLTTVGLMTAFTVVGPLALPLVWLHPTMTTQRKILWTVTTVILTYFMIGLTMESMKKIMDLYAQTKSQYGL